MRRTGVARSLSRLGFRHLRMMIAIAEEGHLLGAAQRLSVTQSAVTKALKDTESMLGIRLFDRTNRGVVPTIFGEALVTHSRMILAQLGHASEEIHDLRDGTGGHVSVGTLHSAAAVLLPKAIALLRKQRPKVIVSVIEGTDDLLLPALAIGELDFVVGRFPEAAERRDLARETLLRDTACVVVRAGHPLENRRDLSLRDLIAWDWILPRHDTTLRRQLDAAFRAQDVEPPMHAVESMSLLINRSLLTHDDYLSVWPWQAANAEREAGRLTILPIALPATVGPIGITTRKSARLSPASEHLRAILREVAVSAPRSPMVGDIPDGKSELSQIPLPEYRA